MDATWNGLRLLSGKLYGPRAWRSATGSRAARRITPRAGVRLRELGRQPPSPSGDLELDAADTFDGPAHDIRPLGHIDAGVRAGGEQRARGNGLHVLQCARDEPDNEAPR